MDFRPHTTPKGQSMRNRGRRKAVTTPPVSRTISLHPEGAQRRTHIVTDSLYKVLPEKHSVRIFPVIIQIITGKKFFFTGIIFPFCLIVKFQGGKGLTPPVGISRKPSRPSSVRRLISAPSLRRIAEAGLRRRCRSRSCRFPRPVSSSPRSAPCPPGGCCG